MGLRDRFRRFVRRRSPWIVHMGCGGCLHGDTEIIVGNEIVGIGELVDSFGKRTVDDDKVVESMLVEGKTQSFGDFSPKEMKMRAIYRLQESKGFVRITTSSGLPVMLTPGHKVLIDTIDGPQWVKARNLKPKDYLYSPRKIDVKGEIPSIIDMLPDYYIAYISQGLLRRIKEKARRKYGSFKAASKKLRISHIRFSDKERMFNIGELKTICQVLGYDWERLSGNIYKTTTKGFEFKSKVVTKELMYLLGLIASDGYVSLSNAGRHATYKISFCNKERKLLNLFEGGIREFLSSSKICKDKATNSGTPIRYAYNPILFHIAKYFGLYKDKDMKNVFSLPEDYIALFLAGYFDGDGHISIYSRERKNPRIEVGISTSDFLAAKRLFLMLKRLGIASKIIKSMNKSTFGTRTMYRVTVSDHFDIEKFISTIPTKHPFKLKRSKEVRKLLKARRKRISLLSMAPLSCNLILRDIRMKKGMKQSEIYDASVVSSMENGSRISMYTANNILSNIGMPNNGVKGKLEKLLSNEYYLDPVSKVESIKERNTVYNISVKETESYVPEGAFVVKNCNGCAIEAFVTLSPRTDIERFGCLLKGSPRHADILLIEGPLTRKVRSRLLRIYNQIPEPKVVLGIGACSISKGIFKDCYNVTEEPGKIIPIDVYVPGCPPRPEAIVQGLLQALNKLEGKR